MENQTPDPAASAPVTPAGTAYVPPVSQTPPPTTPPSSESVPSVPPPAPSSKKRLLLISATVLLLLLVAGGGYFYVLNMQQPKPLVQQKKIIKPSPTAIPTATPMASDSATASLSANWKTYVSTDKIYEIKYPSDIFFRPICPNEELTLEKRVNETGESMVMPTCGRDGRYDVEVVTLTKAPTPPVSDEFYTVVRKDMTVDGMPAQRYTLTQSKEPPGPSITFSDDIYIPYKGKFYQLHLGNKDLLGTFEQMLTTFTFIK